MTSTLEIPTDVDFDRHAADALLAHLAANSRRNWMQALRDTFPDEPEIYDSAVTKVREGCEILDIETPHGAFMGSTMVARDVIEDGEAATQAIRGLKATYRIVQVGRGRGRMIIVLTAEPLTEQVGEQEQVVATSAVETQERVPETDVSALLLAARNAHLDLLAQNRSLEALVADLQLQISTLNHRNEELYTRLAAPVSSATSANDGW